MQRATTIMMSEAASFSPKAGLEFRPIQEVLLRGTWSKGFRIPSFNEAFGLPTTGYITQAEEMYTALRQRGIEAVLARYPREGHGFSEPKHNVDALERTLDWFDRFTSADAAPK